MKNKKPRVIEVNSCDEKGCKFHCKVHTEERCTLQDEEKTRYRYLILTCPLLENQILVRPTLRLKEEQKRYAKEPWPRAPLSL